MTVKELKEKLSLYNNKIDVVVVMESSDEIRYTDDTKLDWLYLKDGSKVRVVCLETREM